jgi:hypothetical protein
VSIELAPHKSPYKGIVLDDDQDALYWQTADFVRARAYGVCHDVEKPKADRLLDPDTSG